MQKKNEIVIFISSPGDVIVERSKVNEIVKRVNDQIGDDLEVTLKNKSLGIFTPLFGKSTRLY